MTDLTSLLQRAQEAKGADRELDALLVAFMNAAMLKPYPPSDDFGPRSHWQFWSLDGKHFLGNEGTPRFAVKPITASVDAALALIGEKLPAWFGIYLSLEFSGGASRTWQSVTGRYEVTLIRNPRERSSPSVTAVGNTPALALISALLKAIEDQDNIGGVG